jgi:hypothetical protein
LKKYENDLKISHIRSRGGEMSPVLTCLRKRMHCHF